MSRTDRIAAPIMSTYRYFGALRFMLASLVMFQHFAASIAPLYFTERVQPYEPGSLAVLVFFCLSGFVISEAIDLAYLKKPIAFLSNRCLRILPHFVIALGLSVAVHYYFSEVGSLVVARATPPPLENIFTANNLLSNLLSIIPSTHGDSAHSYRFIPIVWAVRVEVAYYLVVFLVLAASWLPLFRARTDFRKLLGAAFVMLLPLFGLALAGKIPHLFVYLPYFSLGTALYFATPERMMPKFVIASSAVLILVQFLSMPRYHPVVGFERAVITQLVMLATGIGAVGILSRVQGTSFAKFDSVLGKFTYPLYLYHYVLLIVMMSLKVPATASTFIAGMLIATVGAIILSLAVDPMVDRLRDKVRGRRIAA